MEKRDGVSVSRRKTHPALADMQCVFRVNQANAGGNETNSDHVEESNPQTGRSSFQARKSHRKSRAGCANCKRRRVKCDETKPRCQKCQSHAILCDYVTFPAQSNSRLAVEHTTTQPRLRPPDHDANPWKSTATVTMSLNDAGASLDTLLGSPPTRDRSHIQALHHFTTIAYTTVGGPLAQQVALALVTTSATTHPYLMHALLGFSARHLHHLLPVSSQPKIRHRHSISSSYHWSRALTLYQHTLSNPANLNRCEMDSLLATCLLLDTMSMSLDTSPSTTEPGPSPSTISTHSSNWLGIHAGSRLLIVALRPYLRYSAWLPVFASADDSQGTFLDERPGRAGLPRRLADLCDIRDGDTLDSNPYLAPLRLLVPLLRLHVAHPSPSSDDEKERSKGGVFTKLIPFPGRLSKEFRVLLVERDRRALLLLGYWFGMAVGLEEWWVRGRAEQEGRAVCDFLTPANNVQGKSWGQGLWVERECAILIRWVTGRVGYAVEVECGGGGLRGDGKEEETLLRDLLDDVCGSDNGSSQ